MKHLSKSKLYNIKNNKLNDRISLLGKKLEDLDKNDKMGKRKKMKLAKPMQAAASCLINKQVKFAKLAKKNVDRTLMQTNDTLEEKELND